MADIATRIETARGRVSIFQNEIASALQSKRDSDSILRAATTQSSALAALRVPPSIKCRRTLKGHFGKITALDWSIDSRTVVSASQDGNLLLWNAVTANKLQSISLKSTYVMSVGMEPTHGNLVACGGLDNLCTVYKLNPTSESSSQAMEMASHDGFLSCCRFLSEQHILTSSGDSTCIRWDIASGRVLDTFSEHTADAMFLSLRPNDPNVFCSCSVDQTIKVWDIRSASQGSVQTFVGHTSDVNGVDFMPSDSNALASCSEDGTVRLWDMRSYQQLAQFACSTNTNNSNMNNNSNNHNINNMQSDQMEGFTSIAFSKSGRLIFCGHTGAHVHAFDALSDRTTPIYTLTNAHEASVSCLAVSPNGDGLCTGSWDAQLKIWG